MIQECQTIQDFERLVTASYEGPVFLFKHSTRCPVSAGRWRTFQSFAEARQGPQFYRVLVVENRPVSMHIAAQSGIRHESPQAILFERGEPLWHASHGSITEEAMAQALGQARSA
jgi:bacillithiol system protein YtxJ